MELHPDVKRTRNGWRGVACLHGRVVIQTVDVYANESGAKRAIGRKLSAMTRGTYASHARSRTQSQHVASLKWNIKDAVEALHAAVSIRDWAGVRKYTAQIQQLEQRLWDAEHVGAKRARREPWASGGYGGVAGTRYGRGRLT